MGQSEEGVKRFDHGRGTFFHLIIVAGPLDEFACPRNYIRDRDRVIFQSSTGRRVEKAQLPFYMGRLYAHITAPYKIPSPDSSLHSTPNSPLQHGHDSRSGKIGLTPPLPPLLCPIWSYLSPPTF